jgi:hypothetical protein
MNETTTISSHSLAEQLNEWHVQNYDPHEFSMLGEYYISVIPGISGLMVSGVNLVEDSSRLTMIASESVLSREWNSAEEDEAWAHL